jgi:hypothetical protein
MVKSVVLWLLITLCTHLEVQRIDANYYGLAEKKFKARAIRINFEVEHPSIDY